jgi:hypothetical protein
VKGVADIVECKMTTHASLLTICIGTIEVDWDKEPDMERLREACRVHNVLLEEVSIPEPGYSNVRNECLACTLPSLPSSE